MLARTVRSQIAFLLRQKEAVLTFCFLMLLVLYTFVTTMWGFRGADVIDLPHPTRLMLSSLDRTIYNADLTLFLVQIYPILVVCPAGFLLARERGTQEHILLITRAGSRVYHFGAMIAAFVVTALVFSFPFYVEMALNAIAYPAEANGSVYMGNQYSLAYLEMVRGYPCYELFVWNPYVYAGVGIAVFGLFSGLMGAFSMAVSALYRVKYRITVFLPVFILLNLTIYGPSVLKLENVNTSWYCFVMVYNYLPVTRSWFAAAVVLMALFSVAAIHVAGGRDCL